MLNITKIKTLLKNNIINKDFNNILLLIYNNKKYNILSFKIKFTIGRIYRFLDIYFCYHKVLFRARFFYLSRQYYMLGQVGRSYGGMQVDAIDNEREDPSDCGSCDVFCGSALHRCCVARGEIFRSQHVH